MSLYAKSNYIKLKGELKMLDVTVFGLSVNTVFACISTGIQFPLHVIYYALAPYTSSPAATPGIKGLKRDGRR